MTWTEEDYARFEEEAAAHEAAVAESEERIRARALFLEPRLLLADEPTGNLDSATSAQIHELFFAINKQRGTTIVVVTHNLALAERMLAARFNRDGHEVIDHHTFTIASDGDMQEGISSEASSLAGHFGLGRLIAFYDDNHISIEGDTALAFSEDVGARYEAYGWHVQQLGEDISVERLQAAAQAAIEVAERPSLIICRTHIAFGSPNKTSATIRFDWMVFVGTYKIRR